MKRQSRKKFRNEDVSGQAIQPRQFRLWPGMIIVTLQWLLRFALPEIIPGPTSEMIGVFGGFLGGIAVMVWWALFSRAPRFERWSAVVLMVIALAGSSRLTHESIATGYQGMMYFIFAIPVLSLAFVVWSMASRTLPDRSRRITMAATILLACGIWILLRSEGIRGGIGADLAWRWTRTKEERFISRSGDEPVVSGTVPGEWGSKAEWPGFCGPERNSVIHGVRIATDWSASPPAELWRRPVGPGCSSIAVQGDWLFTHEQLGDDEVVTCYRVSDGTPVWRHHDAARFWDSHAGAGPRATPALSNGYVYSFGATGILNALNARNGKVVWSRNACTDNREEVPGWGFSASPLVVGDVVITALGGNLVAYDRLTGAKRWNGPEGGKGYSSPQLMSIDNIEQVVFLCEYGAIGVTPADGKLLWKHDWQEERIVQPALTGEGDLLISAGGIKGLRRIEVKQDSGEWKTSERWTSVRLRPNFNDYVVHKDHAFGFDGPSLTCLDIGDGSRKWKSGRDGGQILLLAGQDLLLLLSEKGELVLVRAVPDRYTELARFKAIEGKTWNHPVLIGDLLLVRNSQEMAAFRLHTEGS
jgi:outer membrane protein assembly factor BamB